MPCRVEHDAQARTVSVGRLPSCLCAAKLNGSCNRCLDVVDLDLEVEHLRQFARLLGPCGRLVLRVALDVDVDATFGIEELCPPSLGAEIADLEAKKSLIEARHWFRPLAVDGDPDPLVPHAGNPLLVLEGSHVTS